MTSFPVKLTQFGLLLFAVSLSVSHVPAQFGIVFAVIGWLAEGLVNKRWQVGWHPFLGVLAFYIGWNILSAILSPRPLHSLNAVGDNEWPLLIMLMMFWTVDDLQLVRRIVFLYLVASSVAMAYAVWQIFGGVELYRHLSLDPMNGFYRAVGFYGFYLTFAAFAMTIFFLSFSSVLENKKNRTLNLILAALSFFAIVGSFARSIWLSLGIGIPIIGFLKNKKLGIMICSALLVVGLIGIIAVPTIRSRAESILDLSQNQTRLNLWKTSLNIAKDRPILGGGEDNFDYFFPLYKTEGFYDTTVHPHNDYLTVLVASGLPGLLAFVGMWGIALRTGLKSWRETDNPELKAILLGSTCTILGFLVGGFFQNYYGTFVNCLDWWFIAGLLLSSHRLSRKNTDNNQMMS